jgi:predicted DCC family thiol-disulfide oxidoreductase YuxK
MKIVFFDGYCSLCNGWVDWVIRRDKSNKIKFASIQSDTANKMIPDKTSALDPESIIYLRNGRQFEMSSAVLMILWDLQNIWSLFALFFIVPPFIRNFIYRIIAANRYKFFPKRTTCRVPTPEEKERFL